MIGQRRIGCNWRNRASHLASSIAGFAVGGGRRERDHIEGLALGSNPTIAAKERTGMKRFLIFATVAPPLGFVTAFWVMLQIANWVAGSPSTFDFLQQMVLVPTAYLVGLVPALLAAWFDHAPARRNFPHRIALTGLFG
jgi:hypothetical protein